MPRALATGLIAALVLTACYRKPVSVNRIVVPTPTASAWFGSSVAISGNSAVVGARNLPTAAGGHDAGTGYLLSYTPPWSVARELRASDLVGQEWYGFSDATNSQAIAFGAPNRETQLGAVYMWGLASVRLTTGSVSNWGLMTKLNAPADFGTAPRFGEAVALDGKYAIVGSPGAPGVGHFGGAAIYEAVPVASRPDVSGQVNWESRLVKVFISPFTDTEAGTAVAIQGDVAFVGAPTLGVPGNDIDAGSVFVFQNISGTWRQVQVLNPPAALDRQLFGRSLSISGTVLAVGAPSWNTDPTQPDSGAVYLYSRTTAVTPDGANPWELSKTLRADTPPNSMAYGAQVALDVPYLVATSVQIGGATRALRLNLYFNRFSNWWLSRVNLPEAFTYLGARGNTLAMKWPHVMIGYPQAVEAGLDAAGAVFAISEWTTQWTAP